MTMMPPQAFDALAIQKMASGHACLNLTSRINWEGFPSFADAFVRSIGGLITSKSDAPDIRVWEVCVDNSALRLVFDDYPVMVSLESTDDKSDETLQQLLLKLQGRL